MVDIKKVKPGDILFTLHDCYHHETDVCFGRISICVKEIIKGEYPILAHGQLCYRAEDLTANRPDKYARFGEDFAEYLARQDNAE